MDRLKLESLEQRQLLAGDVPTGSTDLVGPIEGQDEVAPIVAQAAHSSQAAQSSLTTVTTAEGEPAPDLVQFAKDLETAGAIFGKIAARDSLLFTKTT